MKKLVSINIIFFLFLNFEDHLKAQCNISEQNFFLDYKVSTCNGMTFQSALGGVLNPFGDCQNSYVSVFVGSNLTTGQDIIHKSNAWIVYPNPVYDELVLNILDKELSYTLSIISSIGQVILSQRIEDTHKGMIKIDVSSLQNGCYFLQLEGNNHHRFTKSFIKTSL